MSGKSCLIYSLIYFLINNYYVLVNCTNGESALTDDYKQFLEDIRPNFEENLHRAFRNEGVRNQQNIQKRKKVPVDKYLHKFHDILLYIDESKISLTNLTLPWIPDFRIVNMTVDMGQLCLDVTFKLGTLRVEGQYEANNLALQKLLPLTNDGKIVFTFKDVLAKGRIGLLVQGDSFVPVNYDLTYESTETEISVTFYNSNGNQIENKMVDSSQDKTLAAAIWTQLENILTNLLHKQLGEVVVGFSVSELLADEDKQLRELASSRSSKANRILDTLLCAAKDFIVQKNYRSVETPSFSVVYRGKLTGVEQGTLQTGVGFIQDLSTLSRLQDLSLYESENNLVVYGSLTLRDFKHGYEKYTSDFESTHVTGSISSIIYKNNIFIKLQVDNNNGDSKTTLEELKFTNIDEIDVDTSGLGSLSWLADKLTSWVIGNLRYSALVVLEENIREAFNFAIDYLERTTQNKKDNNGGAVVESKLFWRPLFSK